MRYLFGFLCVCALGVVPLVGCSEDGAAQRCESADDCNDSNECTGDTCTDGLCENTPVQDGSECALGLLGPPGGLCVAGDCRLFCETVEDCDDRDDCTADACTPFGDETICGNSTVADGTPCAGGMCQVGACELTGSILPCSEQGILNGVAAGGGPYTFDCDGRTIVTTDGIVIDNDLILDGEGNLVIDDQGETADGIEVAEGVTAELRGITVTGRYGIGVSEGATVELYDMTVTGVGVIADEPSPRGIENGGTLTLVNSVVSGNGRGGIGNSGSLTMIGVTVSDNICSTGCNGGGISNGGTLSLVNSTVSGNSARGGGGGIIAGGPGATTTIVNSTISGNTASGEGGAISANGGVVTLANCTVSGNTSLESLGSLADAQRLIMTNTAIDGDCSNATATSNGYNIESPGDTCGLDQSTDLVNVTEQQLNLGPLQDNGGPTETHALLPDSVAIDRIPAAMCEVDEDQRGVTRPQGPACDVGAFELELGP